MLINQKENKIINNNLLKIFIIQYKYKQIQEIIIKLTDHIYYLDSMYYLEVNKKIQILTLINNINKNINNTYQKLIIDVDNLKLNNYIYLLFKKSNSINIDENLLNNFYSNYYIIFKDIIPFINIFNNDLPYNNEMNELYDIIKQVGYSSLKDLFNILFGENYLIKLKNNNIINYINEFNELFIPITINYFKVENITDDFYWRKPKNYTNEDILEFTTELWIKNNFINDTNNNYIKIEGIFKYDIFGNYIKSSKINYQYLYIKKNNIIEDLKNLNDSNININFIKKFIKYNYIGNLYCMKVEEYIDYIINLYSLFLQLTKTSFINIMKKYITSNIKISKLFTIIFLLFLGNDDNSDIASLLVSTLKEKKINSILIYNLIYKFLPFFMQNKITINTDNLKYELEKIKLVNIENIDYKKQLLLSKNIPKKIQNITLDKIEEMKSHNNEYYKQKTFVEYILKFPWPTTNINNTNINNTNINNTNINNTNINNININNTNINNINIDKNNLSLILNIEKKLNNLSYGHNEAKKILLQTIANWISNPNSGGRPIGFVGPPGVGKTLLAKNISTALDIPFAEITLGGQNDGELLHGHGYTYSGSQPGLIIKKMVEMNNERCILYFDELDKTTCKHGNINEITSILIHLTDPNMNKSFQDRFFQGIDFPLDKVIMIFSYNDADKIDPILLDRLCQIKIKPYTIEDKLHITKNFVIPELIKNIGLEKYKIIINDDILEYIINNYTNEAGIRDIKRKLESILLNLNLEILTARITNYNNFVLDTDYVIKSLLKPTLENNKIHKNPFVGIINGLYATNNGDGGIIPIQIFNNYTSNNFEIKLTGNQGNIMKESVQCALTCAIEYIKKTNKDLNLDNHLKNGFHVHAPSGATPKDGPSAGCAFTCGFISRLLNIPIKNDISMTGEIELNGKITKIGGLNFKLIGAKKAGVKIVYIPKENQCEYEDIISKHKNLIDNNFQVKLINYIDEIINEILI